MRKIIGSIRLREQAEQQDDRSVYVVSEDGTIKPLPLRLDLCNHSPAGFCWGYNGSDPAQLALAILSEAGASDQNALAYYQQFKDEFVVHLSSGQDFVITDAFVMTWLDGAERAELWKKPLGDAE